jgi:hypothetical protein
LQVCCFHKDSLIELNNMSATKSSAPVRTFVPVLAVIDAGSIFSRCESNALGSFFSPGAAIRTLVRSLVRESHAFAVEKMWEYYTEHWENPRLDITDEEEQEAFLTSELKEELIMHFYAENLRPTIDYGGDAAVVNQQLNQVFNNHIYHQFMLEADGYGMWYLITVKCFDVSNVVDVTDGVILM